jgi:alternate signal-mediated exported protein
MNKLIKGAVAGAAGIALLLGGAGTFALWNSTASTTSQVINAGTLTVTAASDGVWKDGTTTITPASYRMIPGKTLKYTQTLNVVATGDGLTATMTTPGLTTASTITGATTSIALSTSSSNLTVGGTASLPTVAATAGTGSVVVTVTVTLPSNVTTGQGETLNLNAVNFTLTQTV